MAKTTIFFHGDADGCCSAALVSLALNGRQPRLVPVLEPSDLESKTRRHSGNALFLDLGTVTGKIVRRFPNAMVIDHHPGARLPCVHINPALDSITAAVQASAFRPTYASPQARGALPNQTSHSSGLVREYKSGPSRRGIYAAVIDGKRAYPASYLVHGLFGGPRWIAQAGCVGDWFLPRGVKGPIEKAYYRSKYGRVARAIDSTCALMGERGALLCVRSLIRGHVSGKMWRCLKLVDGEVKKMAANPEIDGRLASLVFSSKYRIKSQVAQLLKVKRKRKIIFVGQLEGGRVKFSMREGVGYLDLNKALRTCLKGLKGSGGGHFRAVGGWVDKKDFKTFFERLKKILSS